MPWPSEVEVGALYSDGYAYYDPVTDDPTAEARSLRFRVAGLRYRHLVRPGLFSRAGMAVASAIELATHRTVSYSLGLPLALGTSARMLDFGCGTGLWLRSMQRRGYADLTGFDLAQNWRAESTLAREGIPMLSRDQLESRRGEYDLVRLEHVFEHLQDPLGDARFLGSLLKASGWLVMTLPSIAPWLAEGALASPDAAGHLQFPVHLVQHSRSSLAGWLREAGFEVIGLRTTRRERFLTVAARPTSGKSE